jgi:3,4-dihydroxyphthalate decarboxylase
MGGTSLAEQPPVDGVDIEAATAIANSCRILGLVGAVREVTGHISTRTPEDRMLIRCRRPNDPGVGFSEPQDIREVGLDGRGTGMSEYQKPGAMGVFSVPGEYPIHAEIYRARPDVQAIVHAHPRFSVLCTVLDIPLEPYFGAYDPGALELAVRGVPTFDRSVLISTPELGSALASTLGHSSVCLMRGHGIVAVGSDVYEATVNAIKLETLCEFAVQCHSTSRAPRPITQVDADDIMAFVAGTSGNSALARATWEHYRHDLSLRGLAL